MTSTVATTTNVNAVTLSEQRKSFYGEGLYWQFWSDGTDIVFDTSADGVNWTGSPTVARSGCTTGDFFSIWYDAANNRIYYTYGSTTVNTDLYFNKGTPVNDGTISWVGEVTAVAAVAATYYSYPFVTVDTNQYPYIAYLRSGVLYCTKSSTNDGTWSTPGTFPLNIGGSTSTYRPIILPLTSGKMIFIAMSTGGVIVAKRYSGGDAGSWGDTKVTASAGQTGNLFSAVTVGDTAYAVFNKDSTNDLVYVYFVYNDNAWSAEATLQAASTATSAPSLALDSVTGDIYCFWMGDTANHIYYKKYSGGNWDANPTDWVTDATLTANSYICSTYTNNGGNIGIAWLQNAGSPYNIRFSLLTLVTYELSGVTYDKNGDVLVECNCYLFKDNLDDTLTFVDYIQSDGATGEFTLDVPDDDEQYLVVAFKDGSPNVFDVTDHVLQGIEV